MTYTVTYKPSAENELIELWIHALDRQLVADAANHIDRLLGANPGSQGESREQDTRILFERPLAAQFEIHEQDRVVEVLKIWWIGG
jgi:hypothetical protein